MEDLDSDSDLDDIKKLQGVLNWSSSGNNTGLTKDARAGTLSSDNEEDESDFEVEDAPWDPKAASCQSIGSVVRHSMSAINDDDNGPPSLASSYQNYLNSPSVPSTSYSTPFGYGSQHETPSVECHEESDSSESRNNAGGSLDSIPVCVENCLALNRAYQEVVLDSLQQLRLTLTENQEAQATLREELDEMVAHGSKTWPIASAMKAVKETRGYGQFTAPYFKDMCHKSPPENDDSRLIRSMGCVDMAKAERKRWFIPQIVALRKAIKKQALQEAVEKVMAEKERLAKQLQVPELSEEEREELRNSYKQCSRLVVKVKDLPLDVILQGRKKEWDWTAVSRQVDAGRSPVECKLVWQNYYHPSISLKGWNGSEKTKLKALVAAHGDEGDAWETIAEELATGRTPWQCFEHYQRNLCEALQPTRYTWTEEENKLLARLVEELNPGGEASKIPWNKIVTYFPGRKKNQVYKHWEFASVPRLRKGPFTPAEDALIIGSAEAHMELNQMTKLLPNRHSTQIRNRYIALIRRGVIPWNWTQEEDEKLLVLAKKNSQRFSRILKEFPGRIRCELSIQYTMLTSRNPKFRIPDKKLGMAQGRQGRTLRSHGRITLAIRRYLVSAQANGEEIVLPPHLQYIVRKGKTTLRRKPLAKKRKKNQLDDDLRNMIRCYLHVVRGRRLGSKTLFDKRHWSLSLMHLASILRFNYEKLNDETITDLESDGTYKRLDKDEHETLDVMLGLLAEVKAPNRQLVENDSASRVQTVPTSLPPVNSSPEGEHFDILPPSLFSLVGFRGLLLQRRHLQNIVLRAQEGQSDVPVPDLSDPEVKKADELLSKRFKSLFFWPGAMANMPPSFPESFSAGLEEEANEPQLNETNASSVAETDDIQQGESQTETSAIHKGRNASTARAAKREKRARLQKLHEFNKQRHLLECQEQGRDPTPKKQVKPKRPYVRSGKFAKSNPATPVRQMCRQTKPIKRDIDE